MHLVLTPATHDAAPIVDTTAKLAGEALVVLFADAEDIARVRERGEGVLLLQPPFHMGEEDAYLVLPDDVGEEIVDIARDADHELLEEALRDGLIVLGEVAKNPRGRGLVLEARQVHQPLAVLADGSPYAAHVSLTNSPDPMRMLNTLPALQCTTLSAFVDAEGLSSMLTEERFLGVSWRAPREAKALADLEPTYALSRRLPDGDIGVELVLFHEDEELVAVLRPACLRV